MAILTRNNIVTNGLVIYLDAANPLSYSGTGTTWRDLSGNNSNATIVGGAQLGILSEAPAFILDSDGKYFNVTFGNNKSLSTNATLEAWIHPATNEITAGDRGTIMMNQIYLSWNKSNNKISSYWYGKTPSGYHEPTNGVTRNRWHHFVSIWDYSLSKFYQIVNGELVKEVNVSGIGVTVNSLNMGRESSSRQFSGGFGVMRVYDKALTQQEVLQNYNATKVRFGLT